MSRVEAAIEKGQCVIAVGTQTAREVEIVAEMRRRSNIHFVALGGAASGPMRAIDAEALGPATASQGGLLVLLEPDPREDIRGLEDLARLLAQAPNKPRLMVVARAFNPYGLPMALRLLKLDHEKLRAKDFLGTLPVGGPAEVEAPKAESKKSASAGPQFAFVGREAELAELRELLVEGGPLALVGSSGVGHRWLIEQAADGIKDQITRVADFDIRRGSAFDTLAARLAELSGDAELQGLLKAGQSVAPVELIERILAALQNDALKGRVMVITGLKYLQARDGSMQNQERLGLLISALLTHTYAPRLVFVTDRKPIFFREGQGAALRVMSLVGLKGRELYSIFEAYGAADVPRDKMGEVHNQTLGHPLCTRAYAIAYRDSEQRDQLIEDKRFLKLGQIENIDPLARHFKRKIEKLDDELRRALYVCGHFPVPVPGKALVDMGVTRDHRSKLCAKGLLEAMPTGEPRRYYVHPLVRDQIDLRDLTDFELQEQIGHWLAEAAKSLEGSEKLAMNQAANRLFVMARRPRGRVDVGYADADPVVESIRGLLRGRSARPDIALQRANEVIKRYPANTELRLLRAEAMSHDASQRDQLEPWLRETEQLCPTPELFHQEASWFLGQRKGGQAKAIVALERGCAVFPNDARLRSRLGALLADVGRHADAERVLREAMDLEPMAPETYARLGEVMVAQGPERYADAEVAIRHAMDQEPENPVHKARLARLIRQRALGASTEDAATLRASAIALLDEALKGISRLAWPFLEMAVLLIEADGDAERADWCIRRARKLGGGKDGDTQLLLARAQIRQGREADAEAALQRLLKGKEMLHQATAALAELFTHQGRIFAAAAKLGEAIKMTPEGAPEREMYTREMAKLELLITSGQAVEIEKAAEAARLGREAESADARHGGGGGGSTVRRVGGRRGEQVRRAEQAGQAGQAEQVAEVSEQGESAPDDGIQDEEAGESMPSFGQSEDEEGAAAPPAIEEESDY